MSWGALHGEHAYKSYEEVRLGWHLEKAQEFIRDVGLWDDYQQLMNSRVMQELAREEIR